MKYQIIAKGVIYYVTIATVIFSHVKISCFGVKAHLVFHWCLYNNNSYYKVIIQGKHRFSLLLDLPFFHNLFFF